jgi:ankyrin repeat protein
MRWYVRHAVWIVAATQLACTSARERSREKLGEMRIPYSEDSFVNRAGEGDMAATQLFIAAGMRPNVYDRAGQTPLIAAVRQGHADVVRLLLDQGADANARDRQFDATVLNWAVRRDNQTILKMLLAKGANPRAREREHGIDPLLFAASRGQVATVKMLLDGGGDPKTADNEGRTALMWAAQTGRAEAVRLLLAHGADPAAIDKHGVTATKVAQQANNTAIQNLLMFALASNRPARH